MKDLPISTPKLLHRLRRYMRIITKLEEQLNELAEDVGDDLLFLEREIDEHKKIRKQKIQ